MNKLSIKIDIEKIDRSKIKARTFTNKSGVEVNVREYEVELLPIREEKVVYTGPDYEMVKVGFLAEKSVKNAQGKWDNGVVLGDAIEFRKKGGKQADSFDDIVLPEVSVNIDDIPF